MSDKDGLLPQSNCELFAAIVEQSLDAIISKDLEGSVTSWNRAAQSLFGWSAEEIVGRSIHKIIPADRLDEEEKILNRIRAGESVRKFETVRLHKDGFPLQVAVTISPLTDANGIIGASKIAHDISKEAELREQLRLSEQQFRSLANSIPQLAWIADPKGDIFWYNDRWLAYTGSTIESMRGWGWTAAHHPDHVERVKARIQRSWDSGKEWEDTFPLRGADGNYRWFLSRASPILGPDGRVWRWFGTNTDITTQRKHEEQIQMLMREVNHRAKNMLAVIQAIVTRTVDKEYADDLADRLRALSRNQDLLTNRNWTDIALAELLTSHLASIGDGLGSRILVSGDLDVMLSPSAAETIGLAIHELSTNAAKYGAMSVPSGRILLNCAIVEIAAVKHLEIRWEEQGGPNVVPPSKNGFGTVMIDRNPRVSMGADVEFGYPSTGFFWQMRVPLRAVQVDDQSRS